jgi:hypothetical protein
MTEYAYIIKFTDGKTRIVFPYETHEHPAHSPGSFGVFVGRLTYQQLSAEERQQWVQRRPRLGCIVSIMGLMAKTRQKVRLAEETTIAANHMLETLLALPGCGPDEAHVEPLINGGQSHASMVLQREESIN